MKKLFSPEALQVLKFEDFKFYFFSRLFNNFAINMLGTIVAWQVFELSGNAFNLGLIGLTEFIPFFLLALFGGYIADIVDRKTIILTSITFYLICGLSLFILNTWFYHIFTQWGVTPIFVVVFITGMIRGFLSPAQSAFKAQLVPKEYYGHSTTLDVIVWHLGAIGGPALGGLIYALGGAKYAYLTIVILTSFGLFFIYKINKTAKPEINQKQSIFITLKEGLEFVFKNKILLGALSLDMFAVLFGGAVAMLPAFAKNVLQQGPEGLGILRAAPAVGAVIMSLILIYRPSIKHAGRKLLYAVTGFGICTIMFALSTNFYLSLLCLAGTGFFDNISMVIRGTIIQLYTPDDMRGRVSSVNSIFVGSSNELGAFESGSAARLMGLVPSVIFGGLMTLVVVGITWYKAPTLRELEIKK
jgi:MFS family permease